MSAGTPAEWVREFQARHGRAPRVLHLGNIANNALHDARLLRRAGVDSDVLCADYYHIMGCPEWEEADFGQQALDHFRPRWYALDLGAYERPRWFVQGPLRACLDYLLCEKEGRTAAAERAWRRLALCNRTARPTAVERAWLGVNAATELGLRLWRMAVQPQRVAEKLRAWRSGSRMPRLVASLLGPLLVAAATLGAVLARITLQLRPAAADAERGFLERAQDLVESFAAEFPARDDRLQLAELLPFAVHWPAWNRLFAHYDVIQAYAGEVAVPLVAGRDYVALEHGTLRELPYQDTTQGRLIALGYRRAAYTFVTNVDCMASAATLATRGHAFVNHPYAEPAGVDAAAVAAVRADLLAGLDADVLLFHPTRHDWVAGRGYADKDNQELLRAFVALRAGLRVGLVCCAWGHNVADSRALLAEAGVAAHVRWCQPMGMVEFYRHVLACEVVADQFRLGAFGGITFKALAVGGVVCTWLDETQARRMFAEPPPVVNCRTAADIASALQALLGDPAALAARRVASAAWMAEHHAGASLVAQQLAVYRELVAGAQADS